ncbi:MAG: pyruvate kinase alpha/beta domain-containing protein [Bacillota bacterium]|nr:pyruvate kinase alpha/beta domain-containing protein [Bacillota bacterium]
MERKITYFEDTKSDNTIETLRLVEERLKDTGINKLVIASTTGDTAVKAMEFFQDKGVKLIVVPHQYDFFAKENRFSKQTIDKLREEGHIVHFGTMIFHTDKLFGSNIPTVIANFLRCFSQGVKVCIEIVLMATDGGLLSNGEKIIAIAGTGLRADTALVMQAGSSQSLSKLRVNEIICKPLNTLNTEVCDN